ncbi:hypothetical protein [Synechococcus sp. M16CYN]
MGSFSRRFTTGDPETGHIDHIRVQTRVLCDYVVLFRHETQSIG